MRILNQLFLLLCFTNTILVTASYNLKNATSSFSSRIVGGTDAPSDQYQFFARVNMNRQASCGGSIIHEQWIVTAAHCLVASLEDFSTVPASQVEVQTRNGQTYQAENWWIHPEFNFIRGVDRLSSVNDIALIRLTTPILDAPVVSINPNAIFPLDIARLQVVGIGLTNPDLTVPSAASTLQHATTGVVTHAECETQLNTRGFPILQESMICIWDANSQPCFGDSGGPLFSGDTSVGYTLLGTAAFGAGDCQFLYPMVYMRISHYVEWMEDTLQPYGDYLTLAGEFTSGGSLTELCFSSMAKVELENKSTIQMKDLKLGDRVLTANGKYEPVYTFGHYSTSVKAEYLQIQTSSSSGILEVSQNHLLFTDQNRLVLAANVKVGDTVVVAGNHLEQITSIQKRWSRGAYAPFTPSGTIVVNGIQSSCFAMPTMENGMVKVLSHQPTVYHYLGFIFESPHRLWCHFVKDCYQFETYNEEGVSIWVQGPMHLLQCSSIGCFLLLAMGIIVLACVYLLELVLFAINPAFVSFLIFGLLLIRHTIDGNRKKHPTIYKQE